MNKQRKVLITTTYNEMGVVIDTKAEEVQLATDIVSRQAAIDTLTDENIIEHLDSVYDSELHRFKRATERIIAQLPPAQPPLYGYKIELLAYIARVMEKEGITAEQAVNSFDDLSMAVRLIIEEIQQKVEEAVMK